MSNIVKTCYAFYRESSPSFAGERTYAGVSNGMERSFFGSGNEALSKCRKMMVGARKNNRSYQVLRYEYFAHKSGAKVSEIYSYGVFNPKKLTTNKR